MDNISEEVKQMVEGLKTVREKFIRDQQELKMSIRKDVVCVSLKDILVNNADFYSLREAIETYISQLQQMDKEDNNGVSE